MRLAAGVFPPGKGVRVSWGSGVRVAPPGRGVRIAAGTGTDGRLGAGAGLGVDSGLG